MDYKDADRKPASSLSGRERKAHSIVILRQTVPYIKAEKPLQIPAQTRDQADRLPPALGQYGQILLLVATRFP